MAAALAESPRSPGKGLEWSQSHSSSALGYSGDTFESFSEEEEESEAPGSWCPTEDLEGAAVSEALESSASLAGQSAAEEEFEAVDPAAVERAAIGKWIDAMRKWIDLKNKDPGIRPDKSVIRTAAGAAEQCQAGLAAWGRWCSCRMCSRMCSCRMCSRMCSRTCSRTCSCRTCSRMCSRICSRTCSCRMCSRMCRRLPWAAPARHTEPAESCAVPAQLMNRILLENTREALKQVTEAEIHEVSTCPDCQQKEAELAKVAFLRKKKTLLEGALIQEKLEEQFYSRDMLTLLGEALRSFPKPSEDPRDLWQRLKAQEWKD